MTFISYAQNLEDVMLWRIFKDIKNGFYIDVGAHDPIIDSVTKAFYDSGWRGINIEPLKNHYDNLCAKRPDDTNLNIAISSKSEVAKFFMIDGLSTLNPDIALRHQANGFSISECDVSTRTLRDICKDYVKGPVHFLKIDVEGSESEVLRGMDFAAVRPWIVLAEATFPNSTEENYHSWEPLLLAEGYTFAYFDGLNRYYLANEHGEYRPYFNAPPNIFDDYIRHREMALSKTNALLESQLRSVQKAAELQNQTVKQQLLSLQQGQVKLESQLSLIINSKSWVITKPLRNAMALLKQLKERVTPRKDGSSRIIQMVESLDVGDAVSNSVRRLHHVLSSQFGLSSEIYSRHAHATATLSYEELARLQLNERDIIFCHYAIYSEYTMALLSEFTCTKVFVYHNITPASYFAQTDQNYQLCLLGRKALPEVIKYFDYFVGDSQYNLDELLSLGVDQKKAFVLPLIIDPQRRFMSLKWIRSLIKNWLFVGRIASNKRQDLLIRQFYAYLKKYGGHHCLYLVGKFDPLDPYYHKILAVIQELQLQNNVFLTGKISDAEVVRHYKKCDIFVCVSEHEGFCVPLIEAAHYHTPVVAVGNAAIAETICGYPGLVKTLEEVVDRVHTILTDSKFREKVKDQQNKIAKRYSTTVVSKDLQRLLQKLNPALTLKKYRETYQDKVMK